MAKKQTEGWVVRTTSESGREVWHYVGGTTQLYKTFSGARDKALRLPLYWGKATVMKATIFYEEDNG